MCGITGIIYSDKNHIVETGLLKKMNERLIHRGPDDEGFHFNRNVGLGHRRLSIIDREGGHQPMSNVDQSVWIVYNGEIYNFPELREELIKKGYFFKSRSDTEVLLHLYEEEDIKCLSRLVGMFAFVIVDYRKNRLFAARDHFGIKPFYYFFDREQLCFASEIKALLENPKIKREANFRQIRNYLTFQFSLNEETFFKNIYRLLPGHYLSYPLNSEGSPKIIPYWSLDFSKLQDITLEDAKNRLRELLRDSIRLQLRSDVPLGSHLSGGLDSTVISCLASQVLGEPLKNFTGTFKDYPGYDETLYAKEVCRYTNAEYHEISPTPRDFTDSISQIIYYLDEPTAGPGSFPQYFVSKIAAQHVKVVLGGQGGDEIYGGYARYLIAYLEECLKGAIFETQTPEDTRFVVTFESILPNLPILKEYVPLMKHFWKEDFFEETSLRYFRLLNRQNELVHVLNPDMMGQKGEITPYEAFKQLFDFLPESSLINKMIHFDTKTILPALLHVEDRVSMAHSIESRVPLLDHRLAEFMATIPPKIKFEGGRTKHLFRQTVVPFIPSMVANRKDKKGFPVPLVEWLKGPLNGFAQEILLGKKARERGIYDPEKLERALATEPKFGRQVWGLMNLELWFQQFNVG